MKTLTRITWRIINLCIVICSLVMLLPSCSEEQGGIDDVNYKSLTVDGIAYYGPETFTTITKDTLTITSTITNHDFKYLENFVIKVQNGSGKTKCTSIEVKIDGMVVISSVDFKKKVHMVTKSLSELTDQSLLEVTISGAKAGCFIELLIEGTLQAGVISDVEGNYYHTALIAHQVWMTENLRTTHFNNGTPIPYVPDNTEWASLKTFLPGPDEQYYTSPAYCWYNNDPSYDNDYGKLYNWGTINVGRLCPTGWHMPSNLEYWHLFRDNDYAIPIEELHYKMGEELMETGTTHWSESAGLIGTNETGFTALPGGFRSETGEFSNIGYECFFWTSDDNRPYEAYGWQRRIPYLNPRAFLMPIHFLFPQEYGLSVRCVKD